ncbi:hypothetical protein ACJMK2_006549 [Sinanodonta woodiana]|uniref:Hexosyltransferase n=1 Tax=Sinanodonta woodiana TaxID=1069815 RepID=A0ABD3VTH3_SINWO
MKGKRIVLAMCLAALLFSFFKNTTNVHSGFIYLKKLIFEQTSKSRATLIQEIYGQLWNTVITPYVAQFVIDGSDICNTSQKPFLLMFVLSLPTNFEQRQAIRQTWGGVAKRHINDFNLSAKLVFMLGVMSDSYTSDDLIIAESGKHKDIVQFDVVESRYNLTRKMMQGLRWIKMFCGSVQYILKADEDTFINVARFSNYFLRESNINKTTIHGYVYPKGTSIAREGKYAVKKEELPTSTYPSYVSGTAYILPFDVIPDMLDLAERLPYCPVDDAFITGVLRVILNINIQHARGFTDMMELKFNPCLFYSKIAVTNIDTKCMNMLWNLTTRDYKDFVCKQSALYDKNICPIFE